MKLAATDASWTPESIPGVWKGHRARALVPTERTGSSMLDDALMGGWPHGSISQVVSRYTGFGFSLIIPALARLTKAGRQVALINTPYLPYAPALDSRGIDLRHLTWIQPGDDEKSLWTVEQLLRSGLLAAVAFWTKQELDGNTERRLQLAAETGACVTFAFRSGNSDGQSYSALKVAVAPSCDGQIAVDVLKCRGGRAGRRITDAFAYPRSRRLST